MVNYVKTGVHDGFLIFLNPIFERECMFQWLEAFRPKWQKYGQPGSQVNLNSELVRNQEIALPNNKEQQKIGAFFQKLDNTITLHQRKLETLKQMKKGFLQQMFPVNDGKVPRVRFAHFEEEWEQRKLGEISKVIDPHPSHRAPEAINEGIPFIGIGDVDELGNINHNYARIVSEHIYDEHHARYDLSVPSIGIGRVASLGKVIRLRSDIGKYAVSPTMSVIQFYNTNVLDFLYSTMNTPAFQKQFKSFSNGSTRQSVGIQDLRELQLSIPQDVIEQRRLGQFFKSMDKTITLHQQKLDQLKI
ncbi:type I restriction enzyme, S subunit [Enterococcus sp. AZ020]